MNYFRTDYVAWSDYKYRDVSADAVSDALRRGAVRELFGCESKKLALESAVQFACVTGHVALFEWAYPRWRRACWYSKLGRLVLPIILPKQPRRCLLGTGSPLIQIVIFDQVDLLPMAVHVAVEEKHTTSIGFAIEMAVSRRTMHPTIVEELVRLSHGYRLLRKLLFDTCMELGHTNILVQLFGSWPTNFVDDLFAKQSPTSTSPIFYSSWRPGGRDIMRRQFWRTYFRLDLRSTEREFYFISEEDRELHQSYVHYELRRRARMRFVMWRKANKFV